MKRTAASGPVVHFSTRNMPAPLLQRVKARASSLRLTIEDTVNLAVELGIATLERQAARAAERDEIDLDALAQTKARLLRERQEAMARSLFPEEATP